MKKRYLFVIMVAFSIPVFAKDIKAPDTKPKMQQQCKIDVLAHRGCCSWHGGVCGCSGASALCCDGTPSPTCGCRADNPTSDKKPLQEDNAQ